MKAVQVVGANGMDGGVWIGSRPSRPYFIFPDGTVLLPFLHDLSEGMVRHPKLTRAVRRALLMAPTSRRKIAEAADVPHSTLNGIVNREYGASREVAEALAGVLEEWSGELADGAGGIRRALEGGGEGSK